MIAITTAHRALRSTGALTATHALMNAGSTGAIINLYDTTRPAAVTDAPGDDPLVSLILPKPAGAQVGGVLTLANPGDTLIMNTGVAVWARIVNGAGTHVLDCDVAEVGGTAEIIMEDTQLYAGGIARMISGLLG